MTLQDALVAYRTYARAEGKSPKTIHWIMSSITYFANFLGPKHQDIGSITGNDLRRFIISLQDQCKFSHHPYNTPQQGKLSPQSIETYCRAIRAFFGFLHREGFIDTNPMDRVKMPKVPETVVPTFTQKEIDKLLAQPNKHSNQGFRDYAILLTFIDTGTRFSELAELEIGDIDYVQNHFRVMGKGQKERYVPFGRRVAKTLMKYRLKHRPEPIGTDNFWLKHVLRMKRDTRGKSLCMTREENLTLFEKWVECGKKAQDKADFERLCLEVGVDLPSEIK